MTGGAECLVGRCAPHWCPGCLALGTGTWLFLPCPGITWQLDLLRARSGWHPRHQQLSLPPQPAVPLLSEREGPGSTGTAASAQGNVAWECSDPTVLPYEPPPLPSCRLSHPGAVLGRCHGLFLPQAARKELGMLRPCLQPRLLPARRDEAVVRWHRMKTLCPGRVPSFPFPHTCCPDLCPRGTGRSLSPQVGQRGKVRGTGRAPRARGGCSAAAVALQDGCPLVMAGLHGGCPVRDLLLGPGPQPVSETRPPPSCFL